MVSVLPSEKKDLQLDSTLSFLDDYVSDALENGAVPYKPRQQRHTEKQPSPQGMEGERLGLKQKCRCTRLHKIHSPCSKE